MTKKDKEKILKILYGCIVAPEVDEEDQALVDYKLAKLMVMGIQEEPSYEQGKQDERVEMSHRCYGEFVDLLHEWYEDEIDNPEELADFFCQIIKGFTSFEIRHMGEEKRKEDADMLAFGKKKKELIFQEKKEIAIATLQAVKNGTQESEKLQAALDWAIETLRKVEE